MYKCKRALSAIELRSR